MASAKMVVKATTFFMVLIIMTGASLRSVVDAMRVCSNGLCAQRNTKRKSIQMDGARGTYSATSKIRQLLLYG